MGVTGIYGLLESQKTKITAKELSGKTVAVDAYNYIYRSFIGHSVAFGGMLTSSEGTATGHIKTLLEQISNFTANGVSLIFVFDNEVHTDLKKETLETRRKHREKSMISMPQEVDMQNARKLLRLCGVSCIEAPAGIEAEKICAELTVQKVASHVLSHDPDALLFGAENIIFRDKKMPANSFSCYNLINVLDSLKISRADLIKIGLMLGTDFAEKSPRIGIKTVMKKYETTELSNRQKEAFQYFITPPEIPEIQRNVPNFPTLVDFLKSLDFGKITIERALKKMGVAADIIKKISGGGPSDDDHFDQIGYDYEEESAISGVGDIDLDDD